MGGAAGYVALTGPEQPASARVVDSAAAAPAAAAAQDGSSSVEAVARQVLPSVVKIDQISAQGAGSGSGVVLTSAGLILTNNHVVELAARGGRLVVSFDDGSRAPASIVGRDPMTDLALIRAKGVSGLTPARLGRSASLAVGEEVVAIGSPFGLESTVTTGIVSALNRPVSTAPDVPGGSATVFPAIQTDAAINPGNSGGPLVNMAGQVVGIDSAIRTASDTASPGGSIGLGFAIPIDEARPIVQQLRNGETPTHARIGITVHDAASAAGLTHGAVVASIDAGGPAAATELAQGDVITKVGGSRVTSADGLVATVRTYRPGDTVTLAVRSAGSYRSISLTLGSDA